MASKTFRSKGRNGGLAVHQQTSKIQSCVKTALSVCIARLKHLDTGETQAMELVTSSMPPDLIGKLAVLLKEQDRLSAVDSLPGSRLRGLYDQFQSLTPSKLTNNSNEWTDLRSGGFESFNLRWNPGSTPR